MISAQSEREKALAILQRVKESEGARPFSESIKARTANAFSLSTSFDIETGDLKRTSPIYELGFLHEGKDSVVAFGRPTEIGGGRQAAFSPFTKAKLKERFGSLFNARATFTQEGLRQKDIPAFALNQLKGRDVWVQNLPFERSFLSARMGKWDFTSWAVDAKLESFTGDSGLYATSPGLKRALHQANINQSSLSSLDNYLGSWGKVFDQFKGALEGPRIEGSTRVFDLMDLTRSVFAMAQTKGHMEKTGELFAGSSIEALSQAIFKMPEPHSALGDAVLQSEISKYMYSTGLSLQEGTLSDHQKDFFRRIGSIQKGLKQEGATKNIIDTFVSQQRFLYSHDPEDLASATIGSQTKLTRGHLQVLQPDGSYSEEPFEFTQRKRGDSTRLTTNIEDFIKGRSLEQSQRHGIQVDYDVAHKAARSLYIDRYQQALHEAGGDTRKALEATGDALASAGDTLKGRVSTLLEREAPKVGIGQTIKANWKLGAVALAGIGILGHLFSGKDDEYNYIEGLRHTGFSGESRALNTDFGSGWQGLGRAFKVFGVLGKEGIREAAHVFKHQILPEALKGKPLALGVAGATAGELGHLGHAIATSALTPGMAIAGATSLALSKYAYMAIKNRRVVKAAVLNPEVTLPVAGRIGEEIVSYIKGRPSHLKGFFELGGGRAGREALIGQAEGLISKFSGKDDVYNTIEGLRHGGIAGAFRKLLTDFGSGWQGLAASLSNFAKNHPKTVAGIGAGAIWKLSNWGKDQDEEKGSFLGRTAKAIGWTAGLSLLAMPVMATAGAMVARKKGVNFPVGKAFTESFKTNFSMLKETFGALGTVHGGQSAKDLFEIGAKRGMKHDKASQFKRFFYEGPKTALEKPVKHTAEWLGKHWAPAAERLNPVAMGLAVLSGYEGVGIVEDLTNLDVGGALMGAATFAGAKYAYMGYHYRKPLVEFWKKTSKEDKKVLVGGAFAALSNLTQAAIQGVHANFAYARYGVEPRTFFAKTGVKMASGATPFTEQVLKSTMNIVDDLPGDIGAQFADVGLGFAESVSRNAKKSVSMSKDQFKESILSQIRVVQSGLSESMNVGNKEGDEKKLSALSELLGKFTSEERLNKWADSYAEATSKVDTEKVFKSSPEMDAIKERLREKSKGYKDSKASREERWAAEDAKWKEEWAAGRAEREAKSAADYAERQARQTAEREARFTESAKRRAAEEAATRGSSSFSGFPEGGVAGSTRKDNTNFGSPWQGQGRIDDENASRLSKRHTVGLNPSFQGSVGIRDIPSFRVEDADTVQAMFLMGSNMNLRLAGIDAPETEHEGFLGRIAQQQPFGQEAAARLQEILGQQESISAVFDPNAEGSYGRAPAVLFGDDGLNINLQLVQEGMAAALPFGAASDRIFDTNEFRKAQRDAQANQRGMWADAGWQAVYRGQSQAKTKLTHTSLTQPERVYENFRTAGSLMRLQNPDAELSEMQAAGGKDDFNIIEGLKHGWAQGNREFNIGDFGSGYIIDKTVNVMKKNTKTKRDLMKGQALARSQCRAMMDPENWTKHHIG